MARAAPDAKLRMGGREWALLLFLSILWGGSFFFLKILVAELPPLTVVLGRVALAALALNLLLVAKREPLPRAAGLWGSLFVIGLINNAVPFTLITFGETRISSGLASILNATTPVFTVISAHLLTDSEKLTRLKATGVTFGIIGTTVLIGPSVLAGFGGRGLAGELACLGAAISYAVAGIYGRRFRDVPPLQVATGQLTASTAILLPIALIVDRPWTLAVPSGQALAALAGLALLATALAFVIYFRILAVAGATNLLLVTFLLPVSALLLGAAFLGETITPRALAGMALIGLGLVAIDGRLPRLIGARAGR